MFRWNEENQQAQQAVLTRPAVTASKEVEAICIDILNAVKTQGDAALLKMATEFDKRETPRLLVPVEEINQAEQLLSNELKAAIETAYANVKRFHQAQLPKDIKLTTQPGVLCELKYQAIEAVGIYVPGGSAPLPSSVIMQGVLAQLSGVQTVVLTTPVKADETINPAILYAAKLCGIKTIVESGGAGAIAAMAYGTESVPKVNKIFGPGNSFVTMAKQLVAQTIPGMAIDMPAGPSEVLVIADERANPDFIAADLLSQAEHGADSQVILLCNSERIIEKTQQALTEQLAKLSRKDTAEQALANSSLILVDSVDQAFAVSAQYGPEHLILQLADAQPYLSLVKNAGSVFVGDYTPESAGDYASGTNHVLPTYGYSATYSSLNLLDFFRTYTVQTISKNGLRELSKAILPLAAAEGLDAHANAVSIRLEAMNNER
ncbi:histidinol dehydrogenase [Pseudoalteromonas sp. Cn5-37]|uniref:histidinol dehydrogenase n=1 Tax=unclassified Pseudoalteromonas TaxID=194690 RepID=UPI00110B0417|nr:MULTISPECIES: histidinol dehydrogenase [unclassified Pseudoalteromonas]MCF2916286.1 histidinol dehydrogenase [Pseudoalteromonas sp. Cn5-37]TMP20756.1 histidinol dehydrogenase [Pseudoalteromonas sp. S2721]